MNLYNIWVSLSEMSDKKCLLFSWYSIFYMYLYLSIYLSIYLSSLMWSHCTNLNQLSSKCFINFLMYWLAKLFKSNSTSPFIQKYITKCNRRIQLIMYHAVKYGVLFSETALVVLLKCVLGGELWTCYWFRRRLLERRRVLLLIRTGSLYFREGFQDAMTVHSGPGKERSFTNKITAINRLHIASE